MTRYAHWLLPFVMPFVLLGVLRALWWAAGAGWSDPAEMVVFCAAIGSLFGTVVAVAIEGAKDD
jgi:hypothetical protein